LGEGVWEGYSSESIRCFGVATQTNADSPDLQHLVANVDRWTDTVTFSSSARNLLKLGLLDDKLFRPIRVKDLGQGAGPAVEPFVDLKPYHTTRIFPPSPPVVAPAVQGDPGYPAKDELEQAKEVVLKEMPEYAQLVREALANAMEVDEDIVTGDDHGMVVTPLGTGSAIPSKYRNGESSSRAALCRHET
jgi:ribonuclease Z